MADFKQGGSKNTGTVGFWIIWSHSVIRVPMETEEIWLYVTCLNICICQNSNHGCTISRDFSDIIPKDTLLWKLKLLKCAAAYANSCLYMVTAEVLLLAR
ncbi:OLC1v1032149C1 [Oldenlandia corymbosa var. corymbosa]|uniref:OLC1v1032149C1 n=1 Tax=Oldenlandia corymbosa var. corymbosa TaxID=529605 RepID=A0AAV1CLS3_OLDCO|nr:OLC1v1032149C1 [Oldenlandia corymbosa var. corymbosa]